MGNLSYIHVVKYAFIDILVDNNRNIHRIKVFFHSKMFKKNYARGGHYYKRLTA